MLHKQLKLLLSAIAAENFSMSHQLAIQIYDFVVDKIAKRGREKFISADVITAELNEFVDFEFARQGNVNFVAWKDLKNLINLLEKVKNWDVCKWCDAACFNSDDYKYGCIYASQENGALKCELISLSGLIIQKYFSLQYLGVSNSRKFKSVADIDINYLNKIKDYFVLIDCLLSNENQLKIAILQGFIIGFLQDKILILQNLIDERNYRKICFDLINLCNGYSDFIGDKVNLAIQEIALQLSFVDQNNINLYQEKQNKICRNFNIRGIQIETIRAMLRNSSFPYRDRVKQSCNLIQSLDFFDKNVIEKEENFFSRFYKKGFFNLFGVERRKNSLYNSEFNFFAKTCEVINSYGIQVPLPQATDSSDDVANIARTYTNK